MLAFLQSKRITDIGRRTCLPVVAALMISFPAVLTAKNFSIPPLPSSAFADTEVSTNIVFDRSGTDVRELELLLTAESLSSNSFQMAWGQDIDGNGILDSEETGIVFGWRNGRYIVEDVEAGERFEEACTDDSAEGMRTFSVKMKMTRNYEPKSFVASAGNKAIFTDLSENIPRWLYRHEWNLMRITRRGVDLPSEWFCCDIDYRYFYIKLR